MTRSWWPLVRRPPDPGWRRVLLLVDVDSGERCDPAVRLAVGITSPEGTLDVLAPVLIPLSTPMGAPPGQETDRAALLLERVERLAGRHGIAVRAHLARGRSVRAMLRDVVQRTHPEVVVLRCPPPRCTELIAEVGTAVPVMVPDAEGDGHG